MSSERMRIVYFGSGSFGIPTLKRLHSDHDVTLVVTQPDRPAGRRRVLTATPIGEWADSQGIPRIMPESAKDPELLERVQAEQPDALVVIAYGHKLPPDLTEAAFSINLHASLLPRWRGAAPINHAIINGDSETGVSVIGLAARMDAGMVYATKRTPIDPNETAGELHDRLAEFGPSAVSDVLSAAAAGNTAGTAQDSDLATPAPKFSKSDGTTDFGADATSIRARVHGLTPWPGCTVMLEGDRLRLNRVRVTSDHDAAEVRHDAQIASPGTILDVASDRGVIACASGALEVLEIQPAGSRSMPFADFARGKSQWKPGCVLTSIP